jgi:shikimate dehydrogenase
MKSRMDSQHFVLLGHPVGHSVSPAIHHAAYDAFGLPHRYTVRDCPTSDDVKTAVQELRDGRIAGANVTVPWKLLALELADEVDDSARQTGAANVLLRNRRGAIVAHNTDAPALAQLIRAGMCEAVASGGLVLGSGGAARAAVVAARNAGCNEVWVTARRWRGEPHTFDGAKDFEQRGAKPIGWSKLELTSVAPKLGLLIQATSAGMRGVDGGEQLAEIIPWAALGRGAFAYDVVYNPAQTPFLDAARTAHVRCEGGLSMLVGQAAMAMKLWLDIDPPQEVLMQRARQAIFGYGVEPHS